MDTILKESEELSTSKSSKKPARSEAQELNESASKMLKEWKDQEMLPEEIAIETSEMIETRIHKNLKMQLALDVDVSNKWLRQYKENEEELADGERTYQEEAGKLCDWLMQLMNEAGKSTENAQVCNIRPGDGNAHPSALS